MWQTQAMTSIYQGHTTVIICQGGNSSESESTDSKIFSLQLLLHGPNPCSPVQGSPVAARAGKLYQGTAKNIYGTAPWNSGPDWTRHIHHSLTSSIGAAPRQGWEECHKSSPDISLVPSGALRWQHWSWGNTKQDHSGDWPGYRSERCSCAMTAVIANL